MPANLWRPLLPYPASRFAAKSPLPLQGFVGQKHPLSLPHPRKAKISATSWRLLPQKVASHPSYLRLSVLPLPPLISI